MGVTGVFSFYYGSMNAGKSTDLIQKAHNFEERNMRALVIKSVKDTRDGPNVVKSRLGISRTCINFTEHESLTKIVKEDIQKNGKIACILIDEAQFLTKAQVFELAELADFGGHNIYAFGLRTDAFGNPFEGSKYLLSVCDTLIPLHSMCFCGAVATMNARCDTQGDVVTEGEQVEVGGNDRYAALCRKHWLQAQRSKRLPDIAFLRKVDTQESMDTRKAG
jgi:thymidine kinase